MPSSNKWWDRLPWADRQTLRRRQVEALERLASLLEQSIAARERQHAEYLALEVKKAVWLKPR